MPSVITNLTVCCTILIPVRGEKLRNDCIYTSIIMFVITDYRASYALAVYAMAVCLSVCVCPSQVGVLQSERAVDVLEVR